MPKHPAKRAKKGEPLFSGQAKADGNPEVVEYLRGKSLKDIAAYCTMILEEVINEP